MVELKASQVFGANITGIESGPFIQNTSLVLVDTCNNNGLNLFEVRPDGSVIRNHDYHGISIKDLGEQGVEVIINRKTIVVPPNEKIKGLVGAINVEINGTSKEGVFLEGEPRQRYSDRLYQKLFPYTHRP